MCPGQAPFLILKPVSRCSDKLPGGKDGLEFLGEKAAAATASRRREDTVSRTSLICTWGMVSSSRAMADTSSRTRPALSQF